MRAFVALPIPPGCRARLAALSADAARRVPSARFVRPKNLHLTLRFLGEVDESAIPGLGSALEEVARGADPFALRLASLEWFPPRGRPRVLVVSVDVPPDPTEPIAGALDRALAPLGWLPERRARRPHVTLARHRHGTARDRRAVAELAPTALEPMEVSEMVLYESRLGAEGADYRALERYALGGKKRQELL